MSYTDRIMESYMKRHEEPPRRLYSIPLMPVTVQRLDDIARSLTKYSGRTVTRNMLYEQMLEGFLDDMEEKMSAADIPIEEESADSFDTVVYPARDNGDYRRAFFEEHEWRYVKIRRENIPKVKYIALYMAAPVSAVTHYAEVAEDGFIYDEARGRYRIKLKDAPRQLASPIPKGSASAAEVRSMKYTTLDKLLSAQDFRELYAREER